MIVTISEKACSHKAEQAGEDKVGRYPQFAKQILSQKEHIKILRQSPHIIGDQIL